MDKVKDYIDRGVFCPKHEYAAGPKGMPTSGCVQCWRAFYTYIASAYPPDEQVSMLNELFKTLKYMAEHPNEGEIRHAPLEISKDAS